MKILIIIFIATLVCASEKNQDESDPKDNYFRYMRAYNGDYDAGETKISENIPRPGGFKIYYSPDRKKRQMQEEATETTTVAVNAENPLELEDLEIGNITEMVSYGAENNNNDLVINDFIRFKREAQEEPKNEKMLLSNGDEFPEGNREPRGATKEQWIKQPYPVQTTNPHRNYDDLQSVNEMSRAPRVHFVTQRRSESAPPLIYHSYDRENRARDLNRQVSRDMDRDINRDQQRTYYNSPLNYNRYRPNPYYEDRRQEYDYPDRYYDERPKQKRIIYFATLPEVVRSPPNVDLKDRYDTYRDRYDYRYITSPALSVGPSQNYRYRNYNPYTKSRYEESAKLAYPTKVSTDVTVREIKKNPERRIYSETDKRYGYKPTYKSDDYMHDKNV